MATKRIGIDIGGTRTRVGAFSAGKLLSRRSFPTGEPDQVIAAIRELLREVGWQAPEAIGVGSPAPLDMRAGRILNCPNLSTWRNVNVVELLGGEFGCPVYLANDATCAAIGELVAGHRARNFIYITWSTGIGGGIVLNGEVVWGVDGLAGEVGHMVLEPDGPRCRCGKRGCLEAIAAGVGIARAAREVLGRELTAEEVVKLARAGDERALDIVDHAARAMGQGIAILAEAFAPELVILGGGLTRSWDFLGPKVEATVKLMARFPPRIVLTALGDNVGLYGAAALPDHFPREWTTS